MDKSYDVLQQLQDILLQRYTLEDEIQQIPRALLTKQEILNRLKQAYVENSEELDAIKSEMKHLNFEMEEAERRREESESRMDIITTQREYEALDKEIHDASENEQRFRREIQKKDRELAEKRSTLENDEQMISMQEKELAEENERIDEETKKRTIQLEKLAKKESKLTPGMNKDILFKFKRIIKNKSGVGIVPVKSNVCSGCHMVLSAQFVNDVRGGNEIQFCPYCSRILFWEEDGDSYTNVMTSEDMEVGGLADLVGDKEKNL